MRNKIKKVLLSIIFIFVLYIVLLKADNIFERKYSYSKYADFYEQKENFDVLFFGTSHMLLGVLPMELWNDYGIVSYNLANSSETLCTNYWQLVNALKYTNPKLVVIDLYALDAADKANQTYLHEFTDMLPLSPLKARIVTDLLPKDKWGEYLFELSLYHTRWNELSGDDIRPAKTSGKGAVIQYEVAKNVSPILISQDIYEDNERVGKEYLQKIIDLCKERDIDVILTYLPYSAPEGDQTVANAGYIIASDNNISYLNFFYEDMGNLQINYTTDCSDIGSHLNLSGARKTTEFIGQYIMDNYDIPDRRGDEAYSFWAADYEKYRLDIINVLNSFDDNLACYLMSLNDKGLETTIYLTEDSLVYQDGDILELLNNIDCFGSLTYSFLPNNYYEGNIQIEVRDAKTKEVVSFMQYNRVEENIYDAY